MSSDNTVEFFEQVSPTRQPINRGVDLILYDSWGRAHKHPLLHDPFWVGESADGGPTDLPVDQPGLSMSLEWSGDRLFVSNSSTFPLLVNRQIVQYRELFDGDGLEIGGLRFSIRGLRSPVATLEGYTEPHRGQRWLLETGSNLLGRGGQRANTIELDDPTVSRAHANLFITDAGVSLQAESKSSQSRVNGQTVPPGQSVDVADSDLIQLGRQLLRLRWFGPVPTAVPGIQVGVLSATVRASNARDYQAAYALLNSVPTGALEILPFAGESLHWACRSGNLVDPLVEFSARLRSAWLESPMGSCSLGLALHVDNFDCHPPQSNYAGLGRALNVCRAISDLAEDQLILSRPAWAVSQTLLDARRLGKVEVLGQLGPIEVYRVEPSKEFAWKI